MQFVVSQLRTLFGVPLLNFSTKARLRHTPAIATGFAEWYARLHSWYRIHVFHCISWYLYLISSVCYSLPREVDGLLRRRIASDESATAATLTSLSELVFSPTSTTELSLQVTGVGGQCTIPVLHTCDFLLTSMSSPGAISSEHGYQGRDW